MKAIVYTQFGPPDDLQIKVTPVIDRTYPLSEVREAVRYLETGRARGKVVINIAPEDKT